MILATTIVGIFHAPWWTLFAGAGVLALVSEGRCTECGSGGACCELPPRSQASRLACFKRSRSSTTVVRHQYRRSNFRPKWRTQNRKHGKSRAGLVEDAANTNHGGVTVASITVKSVADTLALFE